MPDTTREDLARLQIRREVLTASTGAGSVHASWASLPDAMWKGVDQALNASPLRSALSNCAECAMALLRRIPVSCGYASLCYATQQCWPPNPSTWGPSVRDRFEMGERHSPMGTLPRLLVAAARVPRSRQRSWRVSCIGFGPKAESARPTYILVYLAMAKL